MLLDIELSNLTGETDTSLPKSIDTYELVPFKVAVPEVDNSSSAPWTVPPCLKIAVGLTTRVAGEKLNSSQGPLGAEADDAETQKPTAKSVDNLITSTCDEQFKTWKQSLQSFFLAYNLRQCKSTSTLDFLRCEDANEQSRDRGYTDGPLSTTGHDQQMAAFKCFRAKEPSVYQKSEHEMRVISDGRACPSTSTWVLVREELSWSAEQYHFNTVSHQPARSQCRANLYTILRRRLVGLRSKISQRILCIPSSSRCLVGFGTE